MGGMLLLSGPCRIVGLALLTSWVDAVLGPAVWSLRHYFMTSQRCCACLSEGLSAPHLLLLLLTLPACSLSADSTRLPCR